MIVIYGFVPFLHPSDQIRVTNQVTNHTLGTIQFSDGTSYTGSQILSHLQSFGADYNDTVYGSTQAESLFGFSGDDTLYAGAGDDTLDGGDGNDLLNASDGNDSLIGGAGNDTLNGENGDDMLQGGVGNDRINAGYGNDQLYGGDGSDTLLASDGNDTLNGGTGNDYLYGEAGNDTFLYAAGDGNDTMVDASGSNTLAFDSSIGQSVVALYQDQYGQLIVGFSNSSTDQITINSLPNLGEIELSNGNYLTNADINLIIQDMSSYATNNSVSFTSLSDVENNANLMAMVNGAWHAA